MNQQLVENKKNFEQLERDYDSLDKETQDQWNLYQDQVKKLMTRNSILEYLVNT